MATAIRETVTKEVTTTVEEPVVRLDLTEEEAELVYAMTGKVAGGSGTYGDVLYGLRNKLSDVDVYAWHAKFFEPTSQSWTAKRRPA